MATAGVREHWFSARRVESFTGGIPSHLPPPLRPLSPAHAALDASAAAALLTVQSLDLESQLLSGYVHESPHTHAPHCSQHDTDAHSILTRRIARGKVLQHTHAPHASPKDAAI